MNNENENNNKAYTEMTLGDLLYLVLTDLEWMAQLPDGGKRFIDTVKERKTVLKKFISGQGHSDKRMDYNKTYSKKDLKEILYHVYDEMEQLAQSPDTAKRLVNEVRERKAILELLRSQNQSDERNN